MNSLYYMDTLRALRKGEFISVHQMVMDLRDSIWFDSEHAESEIRRALTEYKNKE